jgi:transposase
MHTMLSAHANVDLGSLSRDDLLAYAAKVDLEVQVLRAQYDDLASKLDWLRRQTFGSTSERTPRVPQQGQQSLFSVPIEVGPLSGADDTGTPPSTTPDDESDDQLAAATTATQARQPSTSTATGKRGHGRTPPAATLPTVEDIITVPAAERIQADGTPMVFLGYETTELVDRVPAQVRRTIIKRERWGDPVTREPLVIAGLPARIVPKGKASDAFLQETVVQKFFTGTPLYRQLMDLNSQGADLSRSFLSDTVKHAARLYAPVAQAILADVLTHRFVHADETPLPYQTGEGIKTGYLWAWLAGGQVAFHYGATRGSVQVQTVLDAADRATTDTTDGVTSRPVIGFLVTDGYAGYNSACGPDGLVRVYCWAHARRKFKMFDADPNAADLVERINDLFRIDRHARKDAVKQKLDADQTAALIRQRRHDEAVPKLRTLRARLDLLRQVYPPRSGVADGIAYLLDRWDGFTVYAADGFLPMDNNAAERALRRPVVGRKNYYFVGSEDAGEWAATHYSLMESCRMQDIDPRAYLAHITPLLLAREPPPPAQLTPKVVRAVLTSKR